jgi:hypothetical protein
MWPRVSFAYSLALAHYLLGLVYSQRQVKEAVSAGFRGLWPLALLVGVALVFHSERVPPVAWYLGIHHAFNEAYLDADLSGPAARVRGALRGSSALVHLLLYLAMFRNPGLEAVPRSALVGAALLAVAVHIARTLTWPGSDVRVFLQTCGGEAVALLGLALSFVFRVSLVELIYYHVIFWTIYPVLRWRTEPQRKLVLYGVTTVATTLFFVAVSPLSPIGLKMRDFMTLFLLGSYLHISLSFALSNANPAWIVRLFRPLSALPARAAA